MLRHYPLTLLWFAFVFTVCLMPVPETPLSHVINFDKVVHLLLWLAASLIIWTEYWHAPLRWKPRRRLWLTLALPAAASGLIELLQKYATTCRSGDWMDFLFNAAGVLLATLIARRLEKRGLPKILQPKQ